MKIGAIVTAGGLGKRVGGEIPKQLVKINGKEMWQHSVDSFLKNKNIEVVVLTVPKEWKEHFICSKSSPLLEGWQPKADGVYLERLIITIGGKERWQSVQNGIEALPSDITHVMIHDAARPFISEEIINSVAKVLEKDCCIVAKRVFDTVKIAEGEYVKNTIDRNTVWLAQTPQAAPVALLKELYKKMENFTDFCPTDEASIFEKFGVPTRIVEGNALNDKITTTEDLRKYG